MGETSGDVLRGDGAYEDNIVDSPLHLGIPLHPSYSPRQRSRQTLGRDSGPSAQYTPYATESLAPHPLAQWDTHTGHALPGPSTHTLELGGGPVRRVRSERGRIRQVFERRNRSLSAGGHQHSVLAPQACILCLLSVPWLI